MCARVSVCVRVCVRESQASWLMYLFKNRSVLLIFCYQSPHLFFSIPPHSLFPFFILGFCNFDAFPESCR